MDNVENKQTSVNSTNNTERWEIIGIFLYPVMGGFFLFAGISSLTRRISKISSQFEDLNAVEWFVLTCVVFFTVYFLVGMLAKRANANGQQKQAILWVVGLIVFLMFTQFGPLLYFSFLGVDQSYGSDAGQLLDLLYPLGYFAISGMLLANATIWK